MISACMVSACNQAGSKDQDTPDKDDPAKISANYLELSTIYHELNPENVDMLLSENFIGRAQNDYTWDRESHKTFLSNDSYKVDSIVRQFGEGEYTCTMFIRKMAFQGDTIEAPIMQVKRFEDGKIAEIWEYWDFEFE